MLRLICEVLAAGIGTVAFALIFHVPSAYYWRCGVTGSAGWLVYSLCLPMFHTLPAMFAATFAVVCISRFSAVQMRCPATIFLIAGIFPLVPGLGIYRTAYALVTNDTTSAGDIGLTTLKTAISMVLAILLGLELPSGLFRKLANAEADFAKIIQNKTKNR